MDTYLIIERKNQSMFISLNHDKWIKDIKCIIAGIIKVMPENQQLHYDNQILDDNKTLWACGLQSQCATAVNPALLGLALKMENGEFEQLEMATYSRQPDIPFDCSNDEDNQMN